MESASSPEIGGSVGVSREIAIPELIKYNTTMSNLISKSLKSIKECGITKFVENAPFIMSFLLLEELCKSLGCTTTNELEKRLEAFSMQIDSNSDDADAIGGYFSAYTEWAKFLTYCDELLDKESSYPLIPENKDLLSYRLERLSALSNANNSNTSITERKCKVVIITRGVEEGARKWRQETECEFPMYLDRSRELFTKFNMRRSIFKIYRPDTMKYYIQRKLSGEKLQIITPFPEDDLLQMGGDVLLTKSGAVKFIHRSQNPANRPNVATVMKAIPENQKELS